jgi:hypothetical protein
MKKKPSSIEQILIDQGYKFPRTEKDVREFENANSKSYTEPDSWPSVEDILNREDKTVKSISLIKIEKSERFLAMAAREGRSIPDEIKRKMEEDRKKSNEE